ncbi:MAG TPA: guanylate kinase [Candidatus Omnitrophota bacterium]|nr:guanylate kinase [Candidatus Omnitrophota bacterium]
MKKGKIFILSGPSGSGKTTLYRKLLKSRKLKDKIVKSVSVTTRPQRKGEVHGRDYFFVSRLMFLHKKGAGHFLESQKVFDNYYGTPKANVARLLRRGKHTLLCIDVKGAKVVCRRLPKAVTIFIKTRTVNELKKRLFKRGSEDKKRLFLRLQTAKKELKEAKRYKYIVINDLIPKALQRLEAIILSEIQDN